MINFLLELGLKFETAGALIKIVITLMLIMIFYLVKKSICSFINKSNLDSNNIIKYKKNIFTINKHPNCCCDYTNMDV